MHIWPIPPHGVLTFYRVWIPQPKAVSETDDLELNALMERVARENKEISGDEESDDE